MKNRQIEDVGQFFAQRIDPRLRRADLVGRHLETPFYQHTQELIAGVTYCWRVDEVEADMVTVETGEVWSFVALQGGQIDNLEVHNPLGVGLRVLNGQRTHSPAGLRLRQPENHSWSKM